MNHLLKLISMDRDLQDRLAREGWRFAVILIRRGLVAASKANDYFEDALNVIETGTGQDLDGDGDVGEDTW